MIRSALMTPIIHPLKYFLYIRSVDQANRDHVYFCHTHSGVSFHNRARSSKKVFTVPAGDHTQFAVWLGLHPTEAMLTEDRQSSHRHAVILTQY